MLPGIRRARHARKRARHGTAVAAGEKLPLPQREKRQLVDADEKKFRALVLVDVALALAVAEARGRSVPPRDHVLRFLKVLVQLARHVAPEIEQQRLLELGKRAPQQQRVRARMLVRLQDRLHQQRLRFPRPRRPAKQPVLRARAVKQPLLGERLIAQRQRHSVG